MPKRSLPKPRIFISHSAKEPEADQILEGLAKSLKPDFDVHLDRKRLKGGDDFREEILTWINRAHGAIILFSANALTRPWVRNEASLLASRQTLAKGKSFRLISLLLPPVTRADLEKPDFSATRLSSLELVRSDNLRVIVKKVREGLSSLLQPKLPDTPYEELLKKIIPLLSGIDQQVLLGAALTMDIDVSDWTEGSEYPELLAGQMLERGLSSASKAIRYLGDYIDPQKERRLIELVAPMWVNLQAASAIPQIATNENRILRRLWLNGGDDRILAEFTAGHFVRRACSRAPDTAWPVMLATPDAGEDEAGYYKMIIRRLLKTNLLRNEAAADWEVSLLLDEREDDKEPTFVAFAPPGPSPDILVALRAEFPTLTFFILTGHEAANELANFPADVQFLDPKLQAGEEKKAYGQYLRVRSYRLNT